MSTDEERARLLRVIASAGYSPFDDMDGSTAAVLEEMAETLAPMLRPPREPMRLRRWFLRWRFRLKARWLGLIPVVMLAVLPLHAQAPADSLIGTALSRAVIPPQWSGDPIRVYCITWSAERAHVLVIIDAAVADTSAHPICPDPKGGFYPLWIDGPVCPAGTESPLPEREWILVRCGVNEISRYRRREYKSKADQ